MATVTAVRGKRVRPAAMPKAPHLTREQRVALGKAARADVPRSSHAQFTAAPERPDPVAVLESQAAARVPELLPIRYGRMAVSAFTYYRGAALPMAYDLAGTPSSGFIVQACGDAHLSNFGIFASPERRLVFDINDFDETHPAPWEWDVKRLATSLEIAARDNDYSDKDRRRIVEAATSRYRKAMRTFAAMPALEVWYAHAEATEIQARLHDELDKPRRRNLQRAMAKARTKDNLGAMNRFAGMRDGQPQIIADPPLIVPIGDLLDDETERAEIEQGLRDIITAYRATLEPERRVLLDQYRLIDFARKVVGVGSVGTRSWMALLIGDNERDPLFLQAKEAGPSVLEEFTTPSDFDNCGQRVVVGQRLMQAVSDIFLGWVRVNGIDGQQRDFYLRQLRDWKGSAEIGTMTPSTLSTYGELCGWTLARAHARSGDRVGIAAYLGSSPAFETAICEFASTYADQNERDYRILVDAIAAGRIAATAGV
jgi:uncharacterized protein (DUF2252 family)